MRPVLFALSLPIIALAATGAAQNAVTSLHGTVTDTSGAAIPGATVTITNPAVGSSQSAKANGQGEYSFQQLTPGNYNVTVDAQGFGKEVLHATLLVAQPATVNAQLSVAGTEVTVDVSSATQTLNTTDATIGNAMNNETIEELPSYGRNPQTLLALQPGVLFIGENTNSQESRNGVVSGARSDQTNITLDGIDNNDQIFPSAFNGVLKTPIDSTEEFRVTTSNANADTGRSSGGQVNLVTKAGTNTVHGGIYEYNRNSLGVANDWFNKNAQLQAGLPNRPIKLVQNVYGIDLGGPIKKDKLFLFGNYEGTRIFSSVPVQETVPTGTFKAGILQYNNAGGGVTKLSTQQFASMDHGCVANGTCPWGPGVDPNVLALFAKYPSPNGFLTGDGLNTASYSFTSSAPEVDEVYVSRLDFNPSDRHRFYVRGSFQNVRTDGAEAYPGQGPAYVTTDDSKGISANYTWTISASKVNNLRYGFIRQSYAQRGAANGSYATLRGISYPEATGTSGALYRNSNTLVPLNNIVDDFSWNKGKHTIQIGGNYRRYTFNNSSDSLSYNSVSANASWLKNSGVITCQQQTSSPCPVTSFDPVSNGFPAVNPNFAKSYSYAVTQLAGLLTNETDHFNYTLSQDGNTGALLPTGAPVAHAYRSNELEYYLQDTWKPSANLTIIAGIRHSIQQTPYEIHGQQVSPFVPSAPGEDIHQWFLNRAAGMAKGIGDNPDLAFAPSGQARGGKPFYPMNWGNVAPRLSFAFTPPTPSSGLMHALLGDPGKSSIRAGAGIYYDHFGQGLIANYSARGSFSLNSNLMNPASTLTADTAPRYTGLHNLPGLVPSAPSTIQYPQTPSNDPNGTGFAITDGIDDRIKTPYSEVFDLSWQREIKGGFTFEAAYVGRMGRHLLQVIDLAQPLDLVDPKSGMDYYTAGTLLSKAVDQGLTTVNPIPFFENVFANAAGMDYAGDGAPGNSATQNIYNDLWQYVRGNETAALNSMDEGCYPGCAFGKTEVFWPGQYSSLYAYSSLGSSSYNSAQLMLRHAMKNNIQFDLSYTFSKSLDMGSDSESNGPGAAGSYGTILDAWNPRKNYAVSDFDTTHLLTGDWVLKVPTGKGQRFLGGASRLVDDIVGGWDFSGIIRVSSGLPFGIADGDGWSTNWELESNVVQTGPVKTKRTFTGSPFFQEQAFADVNQLHANIRDPYPGEVGERNFYRGDGYFDIDSGLHKVIPITERVRMSLAAELFNVTNSARFDVHSINTDSTYGPQTGVYSSLLVPSRRLQLSGRIDW